MIDHKNNLKNILKNNLFYFLTFFDLRELLF